MSQSSHGSRLKVEPDMDVMNSGQTRLPPVQVVLGTKLLGSIHLLYSEFAALVL